jgi:hypothetical protein
MAAIIPGILEKADAFATHCHTTETAPHMQAANQPQNFTAAAS